MKKERSLEYLLVELKKLSNSEEATAEMIKYLKNLEQKKAEILASILKEAHDFASLDKIRLEKDEGKLLQSFANTVAEEKSYIAQQIKAIEVSLTIIKDIESDIVDDFVDRIASRNFFSYIENLYAIFSQAFNKINERLSNEKIFVDKWRGGSISHFFTVRRTQVLDDFKNRINELLQLYTEEANFRRGLLEDIKGCKGVIQEKANKLILVEEQAYHSGRLSREIAEKYQDKKEQIKKAMEAHERKITAVKSTSQATSSHVDSSRDFFNIGWALAGDLVDDGRIDFSSGFFVGGLAGGMLKNAGDGPLGGLLKK